MNRRTASHLATSLVILTGLSLGAMTAGCGSSSSVQASTTTVGQELQDLEDARNKGLLTEDEYAKQREEIMKRK